MLKRPYRFLLAAAVLAAAMCLFPVRVKEEESALPYAAQEMPQEEAAGGNGGEEMAGADLSERTAAGCMLHKTIRFAPCGHSIQRREKLPANLVGLSREALEKALGQLLPGASVTGFSGEEVDLSVRLEIPCSLHWVVRSGDDGMLCVMQNRMGEALELVRRTEIPLSAAAEEERAPLREGRIFDDVQALEGYLESLSS